MKNGEKVLVWDLQRRQQVPRHAGQYTVSPVPETWQKFGEVYEMDTFVWTASPATECGQAKKSFHRQTHLCVFKGNTIIHTAPF